MGDCSTYCFHSKNEPCALWAINCAAARIPWRAPPTGWYTVSTKPDGAEGSPIPGATALRARARRPAAGRSRSPRSRGPSGCAERTVRKWVARAQSEGPAGLADRSCRPHRSPRVTPAAVVAQVEALRRQRWTGARIAPAVALSRATVGRILRRRGLARLRQLGAPVPVRRYERARPGELLHVDIKKLGRIAGSAIGSPAIAGIAPAASAGSTSTWPSMTAAAGLGRAAARVGLRPAVPELPRAPGGPAPLAAPL